MDNGPIPGVQIITPTVHFAPDVTDTNALIMITSDEIVDEGRTLSLTLVNPTGGTIGTQNSLTIVKIVEYQDCKFIFIFSPVFPVSLPMSYGLFLVQQHVFGFYVISLLC